VTTSLWLDRLDSRWPVARIKDHVKLVNGFPFDSTRFNDSVGMPMIRIRDLLRGRTETLFDGEVPSSVLVRDGDLLVGMDGDFNAVVWSGGTSALNQRLCLLHPRNSIDRRYLAYVVPMPLMAINDVTYFTTVKHLSSSDLLNERLPLPQLNIQRAIADFLDRETGRIDALIAAKRRMIELLVERDQALVSLTFLPNGAPLARLGYFATVQSGLTVDASRSVEGDVVRRPYLRVANVQSDRLDLESISQVTVPRIMAERCTLRKGDVLMTEGGDLDKLGRGTVWEGQLPDCLHQNHVFAVRPRPDRLSPRYLALVTRSDHARKYFESTGVKTTNLASTSASKILSFPVPAISVTDQQHLVDTYEAARGPILRATDVLHRQLDLLVEHRQALITAAVTGELDVSGVAGVTKIVPRVRIT
jgi:type I restriction enzyme, S subunit